MGESDGGFNLKNQNQNNMNYKEIFTDETQPLAQRRLAFLNDTVEYYSDVSRRNVDDDETCFYSPLSENSDGCAIGRFLDRDNAAFLDQNAGGSIKTILNRHPERIPSWMESLGASFLLNIQYLHDENYYWNKEGLSPSGQKKVDDIKRDYIENE